VNAVTAPAANENYTQAEWDEINARYDAEMMCACDDEPYDDE
jgi:hypothetical protein